MARIHPTAIIDSTAHIGQTTHIGPYCVIGAHVTLGEGCTLHNNVTIAGPTTIGEGNEFYPYCAIGHRSQDLKYEAEPTYLEIGDRNTFREFVRPPCNRTQWSDTRRQSRKLPRLRTHCT